MPTSAELQRRREAVVARGKDLPTLETTIAANQANLVLERVGPGRYQLGKTVTDHRFASPPMTSVRRVRSVNGTSANGMPKESTTCETTRVSVTGRPSASTASAGSMVTARRTSSGMRRRTKPCMTT